MYFSYCIMYRDEENQRTEHNWTTVGLSDDMKYLINSSGVKSPLTASFMKYKHVFHNLPMTNNELNRCLVGADTSCEIETTTMPNEIMKRPVLKGGKIVSETDLSRIEKILLYMLLSSICVFSVLCIIIGFIYC